MALSDRDDLAELAKYFLSRADQSQDDQFNRNKEIRQRAFWSLVIASSISALFASILSGVILNERIFVLILCLISIQGLVVVYLLVPRSFLGDYRGSTILDEINREEKLSRFEDQMIRLLRMKEDDQSENEKILVRANRALGFVYVTVFMQLALWMLLLFTEVLSQQPA